MRGSALLSRSGKGCFSTDRSGSGARAAPGRLRAALRGSSERSLPPGAAFGARGVRGSPAGIPAPPRGLCGSGSAVRAVAEGRGRPAARTPCPPVPRAGRDPSRPSSTAGTLEGAGGGRQGKEEEERVSWEGEKWNSALPAVTKRSGLAERVEIHQKW